MNLHDEIIIHVDSGEMYLVRISAPSSSFYTLTRFRDFYRYDILNIELERLITQGLFKIYYNTESIYKDLLNED